MKTLYKAKVTTKGARDGHSTSDDGVLDINLSTPKDLGGKGDKNTNPEQLFGAAYSASFGQALEEVAKEHGFDLGDFSVTAIVKIGKNEEDELQLAVVLDAYIPTADVESGERLVNEAYELCPYSRATRDNLDVTLNLLLDQD
ncbi:Ohr family peroxiredoxin [Salegentibacter chungangensis]|uniref:Ohr family peroxiredoxin n=1 Tax=Salegentibacter chungangensis TaxID=1335724 RepID=A0ABW3NNW8_9FLAO